jgi:hypothetical protein
MLQAKTPRNCPQDGGSMFPGILTCKTVQCYKPKHHIMLKGKFTQGVVRTREDWRMTKAVAVFLHLEVSEDLYSQPPAAPHGIDRPGFTCHMKYEPNKKASLLSFFALIEMDTSETKTCIQPTYTALDTNRTLNQI